MTDLTPQTPGTHPGEDLTALHALAAGTVEDLLAALPTLDEIQLDQLEAIERAGKGRTTALGALIRERDRRDAMGAPEPAAVTETAAPPTTPSGRPDYSRMRARDVDPRTLTGNVLTLDGWVCPHPAAAEG